MVNSTELRAQQVMTGTDSQQRITPVTTDPVSSEEQQRFVTGEKGEKIFFLKNPGQPVSGNSENGQRMLPSRKSEPEAAKPE